MLLIFYLLFIRLRNKGSAMDSNEQTSQLSHHGSFPPPQSDLVQFLDHFHSPLGVVLAIALQNGFENLMGVGVCAKQGPFQHVQVHPFVLWGTLQCRQSEVYQHHVQVLHSCLQYIQRCELLRGHDVILKSWRQQHVRCCEISMDDVGFVSDADDLSDLVR